MRQTQPILKASTAIIGASTCWMWWNLNHHRLEVQWHWYKYHAQINYIPNTKNKISKPHQTKLASSVVDTKSTNIIPESWPMALHHCCIESSPPKNPTLKAGSLLYTSAPRKKQRMRLKFGIIHISMDNFLDKCKSQRYICNMCLSLHVCFSLSLYVHVHGGWTNSWQTWPPIHTPA